MLTLNLSSFFLFLSLFPIFFSFPLPFLLWSHNSKIFNWSFAFQHCWRKKKKKKIRSDWLIFKMFGKKILQHQNLRPWAEIECVSLIREKTSSCVAILQFRVSLFLGPLLANRFLYGLGVMQLFQRKRFLQPPHFFCLAHPSTSSLTHGGWEGHWQPWINHRFATYWQPSH